MMVVNSMSSLNTSIAESILIINPLALNNNGDYRCIGNYSSNNTLIQSVIIPISK